MRVHNKWDFLSGWASECLLTHALHVVGSRECLHDHVQVELAVLLSLICLTSRKVRSNGEMEAGDRGGSWSRCCRRHQYKGGRLG